MGISPKAIFDCHEEKNRVKRCICNSTAIKTHRSRFRYFPEKEMKKGNFRKNFESGKDSKRVNAYYNADILLCSSSIMGTFLEFEPSLAFCSQR